MIKTEGRRGEREGKGREGGRGWDEVGLGLIKAAGRSRSRSSLSLSLFLPFLPSFTVSAVRRGGREAGARRDEMGRVEGRMEIYFRVRAAGPLQYRIRWYVSVWNRPEQPVQYSTYGRTLGGPAYAVQCASASAV